jgi:hypothetical protein
MDQTRRTHVWLLTVVHEDAFAALMEDEEIFERHDEDERGVVRWWWKCGCEYESVGRRLLTVGDGELEAERSAHELAQTQQLIVR